MLRRYSSFPSIPPLFPRVDIDSSRGVVQLVKLFDIYEGKAAELILQAVYESKPEMIEDVDFGGTPLSRPSLPRRLALLSVLSDMTH